MTAYDDLKAAGREVATLRRIISQCDHLFETDSPAAVVSHALNLGESLGTKSVWVKRELRLCPKCGLRQERRQFAPDDAWGRWKDC